MSEKTALMIVCKISFHSSEHAMHVFSTISALVGLWSCLAFGFTNPIKTGSDPHIAYHDGM
jgi:hypothetical protein